MKKKVLFVLGIMAIVFAISIIDNLKAGPVGEVGAKGPLMESNQGNWKCGCTESRDCGSVC